MSEIRFGVPQAPVEATPNAAAVSAVKEVEKVADATSEVVSEIAQDVHTHESVLVSLFADLEGMVHMGKSEIQAVVERWKAEYKKL